MLPELLPPNSLLLAEDGHGNYANACIVQGRLVTAGHVAAGNPTYIAPSTNESVRTPFLVIGAQDLAISLDKALAPGFTQTAQARLNEALTIVGHHGNERREFRITTSVSELQSNGRVVVKRTKGAQAQPGMSGSPAITSKGEFVGILVAGVDDTDGQQLYIETIQELVRNS